MSPLAFAAVSPWAAPMASPVALRSSPRAAAPLAGRPAPAAPGGAAASCSASAAASGAAVALGLAALQHVRGSRRRGVVARRQQEGVVVGPGGVAVIQREPFPAPGVMPTTTAQLVHHILVASVVVGTPFLAPWALPSLPLVLFMFLYADVYSAVLHAALDREECLDIGVLKSAAVGFQMHHDHPMESTQGQGLYRLACDTVRIQWITGGCGMLMSTRSPLALSIIVLKWLTCAYGTQLGHYWAHMPAQKRPRWVAMLQRAHLFLPAKHHGAHHTPPYDKNFGIVHGLANRVLNPILKGMPFKPLLALWAFMTVFDIALIERLFATFA